MHNVGHHIIKFLSLILFTLLSITGEFAGEGMVISGRVNPKVAFARQQHPSHKVYSSSQVSRPDVLQVGNYIRVRYKASYLDCYLTPVVCVFRHPLPVYVARSYPEHNFPVISLAYHISGLRGPPSFVA